MNTLKQFLMKASAYTIIILSVFYVFGAFSGITEHGISWHKYLLILGYGLLIATAEVISAMLAKHRVLANLINYAVLVSGFLVIFVLSTETSGSIATKVFIALSIFTVLYVPARLCIFLIKKAICRRGGNKNPPQASVKDKTPKYHSLYGDN